MQTFGSTLGKALRVTLGIGLVAIVGAMSVSLFFPKELRTGSALALDYTYQLLSINPSRMGNSGSGAAQKLGYTFVTTPVSIGSVRKEVYTTGAVTPKVTVLVGSEISGRIKLVNVDFNDKVKAGQILAEIDSKSFNTKVKQARADFDMAQAELRQHSASMIKAKAVLEDAKESYLRQKGLAGKSLATFEKLSTARKDLKVAEADIELLQANIESTRAKIAQRAAVVEQTRIELEQTRIRSPIDGTVILRQAHVGQAVAASLKSPDLFSISGDLRNIILEAQVNETDIGTIKEGQPVTFSVDAYPGEKFIGKIEQIRFSPVVEKTVVTYVVTVAADNVNLKLLPGMTASLVVETGVRHNALRIPTDALQFKFPKKAVTQDTSERLTSKDKLERLLAKARSKLALNERQYEQLRDRLMAELAKEPKLFKSSKRRWAQLELVLGTVLQPEQVAALDKWKKKEAVRQTRPQTIWVMTRHGRPKRRHVAIGLSGAKFAEVVSGDIEDGDQVIIRARRLKKK